MRRSARRPVHEPVQSAEPIDALGARLPGDRAVFGPDHIEHGSLSMTTVMLDSRPAAQAA